MSTDTRVKMVCVGVIGVLILVMRLQYYRDQQEEQIKILTDCIRQQVSINDTSRLAIADLAAELETVKRKQRQ